MFIGYNNESIGFQSMKVTWNEEGYPYLLLNEKQYPLIPQTSVSKDGIGCEPFLFVPSGVRGTYSLATKACDNSNIHSHYTIDAFAPPIRAKRALRDKENDTRTKGDENSLNT
jgi:hypothetical protein